MSLLWPSWMSLKPRTLIVTWLLAVLLGLYLIENLWIDEWVQARFASMPALTPEPLSSFWFAAFGLGGIVCVVLIVGLVLVSRHKNISAGTKVATGIAVFCACGLFGTWYSATGQPSAGMARVTATQGGGHQVTLKWNPSTTPGVSYNVYRSETSGQYANHAINPSLLTQTTYVDGTVVTGRTYFYVTRAADGQGHESVNSNEAKAVIP